MRFGIHIRSYVELSAHTLHAVTYNREFMAVGGRFSDGMGSVILSEGQSITGLDDGLGFAPAMRQWMEDYLMCPRACCSTMANRTQGLALSQRMVLRGWMTQA